MRKSLVRATVPVTTHYGYFKQSFRGPGCINETIYVVYKGTLYSNLRPVAVVKTESAAVGRCKCLELENYG